MTTHLIRNLALVALLGTWLVTGASATEKVRMTVHDKGRGVRSLPAARAESGPTATVAQVQGVARAGRGDTLVVGNTAIRITPRTAIQSLVAAHADAALRPGLLTGRTVTVFGRPSRGGKIVDASMVIVVAEPHERTTRRPTLPTGGDQSRYTIPGAREGCGQLRPGAPE